MTTEELVSEGSNGWKRGIRNEVLEEVEKEVNKLHLKGLDRENMNDCTDEEKEHYLLGIDDTCYDISEIIRSLKVK